MYQLKVILASTRPTRKGPAVAEWIMERIREHGKFEAELLDLKAINLPFMDEPEHPRLRKYQHEHTKAWPLYW
jgi:NAD(P)H-dependent FMN reductase